MARFDLADAEWGIMGPLLLNKLRGDCRARMIGEFSMASSSFCARARHGATCLSGTGPTRGSITVSTDGPRKACG